MSTVAGITNYNYKNNRKDRKFKYSRVTKALYRYIFKDPCKSYYTPEYKNIKAKVVKNNNVIDIVIEIWNTINGIVLSILILTCNQICNIVKIDFDA